MTTTHSTRPSEPDKAREWDAGYSFGFHDDGFISPIYYRYYSDSYITGYEVGKAYLNYVIDEYRKPREY